LDKEKSNFDKLMVYARFYHSFKRNYHTPGGCPILNTAVEADDTNILLKARAAKAVLRWKDNIEAIVKAGIDTAEFKPDADPAVTALSIIALIEGGIMISKVTDSYDNLDKVLLSVEQLIRQLKV
jgi:hypothetical protein